MKEAIVSLKELLSAGILEDYALGGGIAATFYIEPILTYDLDVFVLLPETSGPLITLSPLSDWFKDRGVAASGEHVVIGGLPVQFIPAYNQLVEEAVRESHELPFGDTSVKVVRPEYLAAIMLQTGRPKDQARLALFVESAELGKNLLSEILRIHSLSDAWQSVLGGESI